MSTNAKAPAITQEQLSAYQNLYPEDEKIQSLTLSDVLRATAGKQLDWDSLTYPSAEATPAAAVSLSPCQMAIGYVIFDVICLALGARGLRASVSAATVEAIAIAAAPTLSQIEIIAARIGAPDASKTDVAYGVFQILKTVYSGGSFAAVFAAFRKSLTWWDGILYGVTGVATIAAFFLTDGALFVAQVVLLLTTTGFFAKDLTKAISACSLKPATLPGEGTRYRDQSTERVYVTLDGVLRWIPDTTTYFDLYADWNGVINVPNVNNFEVGEQITEDAALINGAPDGKVYLLLAGGKRWITSPAVFSEFGFAAAKIRPLAPAELASIPDGPSIPRQ